MKSKLMKWMKSSLMYIFAFLIFLPDGYAQNSKVDSNLHVYLLIGQSNMAGRGALSDIKQDPDSTILMLDLNNNWVVGKDPLHFDKPASVGVGPGISFAKGMQAAQKNIRVGLIPCALGGSPIKVWQPDAVYLKTFHPYDDAIARARIAMRTGLLKGIIWHQGESDNDSSKAQSYLEKLQVLISRLRSDLGISDLPFVAGEIGYFNKQNFINVQVNKLPDLVNRTAIVSAKGLKDKGDQLHFDSQSARTLGERYAVAMQRIQTPPTVVLTFDDAEASHYTVVAPLLKKYGFAGTFFVCDFPLKVPSDTVLYMNWKQIKSLHDMGFEIGNHSGHHKNLTKLKWEDIESEVGYIEDQCKKYNIPKPTSFAYPGNRTDSLSQSVLKAMGYKFARSGGSMLYAPMVSNAYAVPSYTVASTARLEERTRKALDSLQPGQTLVLTFHGVPDMGHPDYSTSPELLESLLMLIQQRKYRVIAMKDL